MIEEAYVTKCGHSFWYVCFWLYHLRRHVTSG